MNILRIITLKLILAYTLNGQSSIDTFERYNKICSELGLGNSNQIKNLWELGFKVENIENLKKNNQNYIKKTIIDEIAPNLIYNYLISKSIFQIEVLEESLEKMEGQMTFLTYRCKVIYESTDGIDELKDQKYIYLCVDRGYNSQGASFTTAHTSYLQKGGKYFVNVKKKNDKFFISNDSKIVKCKIWIGKDSITVRQTKRLIKDLNELI